MLSKHCWLPSCRGTDSKPPYHRHSIKDDTCLPGWRGILSQWQRQNKYVPMDVRLENVSGWILQASFCLGGDKASCREGAWLILELGEGVFFSEMFRDMLQSTLSDAQNRTKGKFWSFIHDEVSFPCRHNYCPTLAAAKTYTLFNFSLFWRYPCVQKYPGLQASTDSLRAPTKSWGPPIWTLMTRRGSLTSSPLLGACRIQPVPEVCYSAQQTGSRLLRGEMAT